MNSTPLPSHRHRRALREIQATTTHSNESAADTKSPNRINQSKSDRTTTNTSLSSTPFSFFGKENDVPDESTDQIGSLKSSRLMFTAPESFTSTPISLPPKTSTAAAPTPAQRMTMKDPGPNKGKLGEIKQARTTSIFPVTATASATPVTPVNTSVDVALLQQSVEDILNTKRSAKTYIETMRKKLQQYMLLNKQYTQTHASEQLRNKGIASLKKTLTIRIEQLELLQKQLKNQVLKKEQDAKAKLEASYQELYAVQQQVSDLTSSNRKTERAMQAQISEHERAMEQLRDQNELQLESARRDAHTNEAQLRVELNQVQDEKLKLQQLVESMEEEMSQLKVQVRMQEAKETEETTSQASKMAETIPRLEIALENACNEVDRLQADLKGEQEKFMLCQQDLGKVIGLYEKMKTACHKLQKDKKTLVGETEQLETQCKQLEIERDESRDISDAYQVAYEQTLKEKQALEKDLQVLISDFELLRSNLCELMVEQSESIPLPLTVLDENEDLAILLSSTELEASMADVTINDENMTTPISGSPLFTRRIGSSSRIGSARSSVLSPPTHEENEDEEEEEADDTIQPEEEDINLDGLELDSSYSDLNLSRVARRLSMNTTTSSMTNSPNRLSLIGATNRHPTRIGLFQSVTNTPISIHSTSSPNRNRSILSATSATRTTSALRNESPLKSRPRVGLRDITSHGNVNTIPTSSLSKLTLSTPPASSTFASELARGRTF